MLMKMQRIVLVAAILAIAGAAHADRGLIPFTPGVEIFEPTQRAMIAWNGREEILLLSTDLRASRPTRVLEVLPLPSEPTVHKGDISVFRRATTLINSKLAWAAEQKRSHGDKLGAARPFPAGEVTLHERIGPHDISVTHVLDSSGFVAWVERYLRSAGVHRPHIPVAMKEVVGQYLRDGFKWFVFDVISLDTRPKTNDAIQYRFATPRLFYPMRITRTASGFTSVDLLVLTRTGLKRFPGISRSQVELRHPLIKLSDPELRGLDREMAALFPGRGGATLRIWRIQGYLASFRDDLIAW